MSAARRLKELQTQCSWLDLEEARARSRRRRADTIEERARYHPVSNQLTTEREAQLQKMADIHLGDEWTDRPMPPEQGFTNTFGYL